MILRQDMQFDTAPVKVAEHSFCAHFCWYNSARTQGLQKTNMQSIERSFYLLNTCSICTIFSTIEHNVLMALVFCHKDVRKGNDAKNPGILSFFFVTERTQLNAAHV